MGWLMDSLFSGNLDSFSKETHIIFSLVVIFGLFFLFLSFVLKIIKYYFETLRPIFNAEKIKLETNNNEKDHNHQMEIDNNELFKMILELYEKIGNMTTDYAGKYTTKAEFCEFRKKLENLKDDISKIKGRLGI